MLANRRILRQLQSAARPLYIWRDCAMTLAGRYHAGMTDQMLNGTAPAADQAAPCPDGECITLGEKILGGLVFAIAVGVAIMALDLLGVKIFPAKIPAAE